jgi:DNA sulfur modification protein DndD
VKLISASICNFRLIRNLELDFSVDANKPLTVIRAANETGKTTCQTALIWCLYGSKSLPNRGDYSLFPSDKIGPDNKKIEVSVDIEFELDHVVGTGKGKRQLQRTKYRMSRSCTEKAPQHGNSERTGEARTLWKVTSQGTTRVLDSDVPAIIENALPESLKDVYFTDGDSAMSFIEAAATQGVKRKRVTNAIEALLGLKVLDSTIKHVSGISSKFSQEIDNKDYAEELIKINDKISGFVDDKEEAEEELKAAEDEIKRINKELVAKDREIEAALKLGDKDKLINDLDRIKKSTIRTEESLKNAYKGVSKIISSESMSRAILSRHLEASKLTLNDMNRSKQLPKVNVPILEEIIDRDLCFCGSDLSEKTIEGKERRKRIIDSIEESRESDLVQEAATSLFYQIRSVSTEGAGDKWLTEYSAQSQILQNADADLNRLQVESDSLEKVISNIEDSHLQKLREVRQNLNSSLLRQHQVEATRNDLIDKTKIYLREANEDCEKVRKKLGKTNTSAVNWDVANAIKTVFEKVVERLRNDELEKVSSEMNRIFLSMIGADSSNSDLGLIKEARLTEQFDIVVFGPNGHSLNPDQDLNGASRRAITLAFILALTKVSEVEAPNIIDTPLGMMAGYVKQSVLLRTIEEGSQVILFLTHDEINGVEEILDSRAGLVFTLTNVGHYPKMLANRPETQEAGVVRCNCNHRQCCEICERQGVKVA